MHTDTIRKLYELADTCILLGQKERPELIWLKEKHSQIQKKYQLKNKTSADEFLYEHMYGHSPEKPSDTLKLRYWRTGRYTPGNREQCLLFGTALELSDEDMIYMIQNYYDRNLTVYLSEAAESDTAYMQKCTYLKLFAESYLDKVSSERLTDLRIPDGQNAHYLRHLYFTDAFSYVHMPEMKQNVLSKHITSTRYDSEFTRQMKLLGEIPRKTMVRHLLIFGLPDLTLEKMNQLLTFFGYLPLTEDHTLTCGEHLDWLLIHLFELYGKECERLSSGDRLDWFQEASRILDAYFTENNHPHLRFMYFKALNL